MASKIAKLLYLTWSFKWETTASQVLSRLQRLSLMTTDIRKFPIDIAIITLEIPLFYFYLPLWRVLKMLTNVTALLYFLYRRVKYILKGKIEQGETDSMLKSNNIGVPRVIKGGAKERKKNNSNIYISYNYLFNW